MLASPLSILLGVRQRGYAQLRCTSIEAGYYAIFAFVEAHFGCYPSLLCDGAPPLFFCTSALVDRLFFCFFFLPFLCLSLRALLLRVVKGRLRIDSNIVSFFFSSAFLCNLDLSELLTPLLLFFFLKAKRTKQEKVYGNSHFFKCPPTHTHIITVIILPHRLFRCYKSSQLCSL